MTSIEWLIEGLVKLGYLHTKNYGNSPQVLNLIEQAKEMEKQQTFRDFNSGLDISIQEAYRIAQKSWAREYKAQQYYNETYKKD